MTPSPSSPPGDLSSHLLQISHSLGVLQGKMDSVLNDLSAERRARETMATKLETEIKAVAAEAKTRADETAAEAKRQREEHAEQLKAVGAEVHQIKSRLWYASGIAAAILWIVANVIPHAITLLR